MKNQRIGIIGGGITGLTVGYELLKLGYSVTIFEKYELGGLISSLKIGNSYLENFYHHIFLVDRPLLELVHEIDLDEKLLWRETPMGFFCNNHIYPFGTPKDLLRFKPLSLLDRLKFGLTVFYFQHLKNWRQLDNISVEEWFRKHHCPNIFETIWKPLLKLKFGDNYSNISAAWIWGRIYPRANSRQKGKEKLGYFTGGYKVFVDRLVESIRSTGCDFQIGAEIEKIKVENGQAIGLQIKGEHIHLDDVIVTIAPSQFMPLCTEIPSEYGDFLKTFHYNGVICLILKLNRSLSPIYWLNISDPEIPFGGVIEHTNFIPPSEYDGVHLVYVFNYLPATHKYYHLTREELLSEYWEGLKKIFPALEKDWIDELFLTRTGYATPIYFLNYAQKKPPYETPIKNLYMVNMTQIYPEDRNVSACIAIAREFCQKYDKRSQKSEARSQNKEGDKATK